MKQFSGEKPGNGHRVAPHELSFPKSKRLLKNEQFKAVLAHNLHISNGLLTLYMAANNCDDTRLGISVGKATGKAVLRNRLKRLLREVFRQNQNKIPTGFDYLVFISQTAVKSSGSGGSKKASLPTFEQLSASFLDLVAKSQVKIT